MNESNKNNKKGVTIKTPQNRWTRNTNTHIHTHIQSVGTDTHKKTIAPDFIKYTNKQTHTCNPPKTKLYQPQKQNKSKIFFMYKELKKWFHFFSSKLHLYRPNKKKNYGKKQPNIFFLVNNYFCSNLCARINSER